MAPIPCAAYVQVAVHGPVAQGTWLLSLGMGQRLQTLLKVGPCASSCVLWL